MTLLKTNIWQKCHSVRKNWNRFLVKVLLSMETCNWLLKNIDSYAEFTLSTFNKENISKELNVGPLLIK